MNLSLANAFGTGNSQPGTTGGTPATPAAPAAPAAGNDGMQQQNKGAGAGNAGEQPLDQQNNQQKKDSSPLDAFENMFKIDDKAQPVKDPMMEPLFNLDPKTLAEAVNKMDFAKHISPELAQKALQGDVAALQQMLNGSSRAVFMQAAQMLTGVMQKAFTTNNSRLDSSLSGRFRDFQIQSSPSTNKALAHPAAQPVLSAIRKQISTQNPGLPAHEVTAQAENYFLAMSKAITSVNDDGNQANGRSSPAAPKDADWTTYLEGGSQSQQ